MFAFWRWLVVVATLVSIVTAAEDESRQYRSSANAPYHWSYGQSRIGRTSAGVRGAHGGRLPSGVSAGGDAETAEPVLNFQLQEPAPLLLTDGSTACTLKLTTRSFQNSYGKPSITTFSPSAFDRPECQDPSAWTGLELTLSGASAGRQFDRLGTVWLGNDQVGQGVEVWRTDNPEPTKIGVKWETSKDVGKYFSLFQQEATVIFDFPNIVDETYTGALNTTLSITAFISKSPGLAPLAQRAPHLVLPISQGKDNDNSLFQIGGSKGAGVAQVQIPKNAARASVEIYATGTATEEFWYTLVPDRYFKQLTNASEQGYYGKGPYREVQLHIDGKLAGIVSPYPVIYTGGISPLLWRPDAAYGAFDSPTYSIDITPFLGLLTDGSSHEFRIRVVSGEKDGEVNDGGWFVSGNVAVFVDESEERTTGEILSIEAEPLPRVAVTGHLRGDPFADGSLSYVAQLAGPRKVTVRGRVLTGSQRAQGADATAVVWHQEIAFENRGELSAMEQSTVQSARGWSRSVIHDGDEATEEPLGATDHDVEKRGARQEQKPFIHAPDQSHLHSRRALMETTFSFPLTVDTSITVGVAGDIRQRIYVNHAFKRQAWYAGPTAPASSLIGSEQVLSRDGRGGNWRVATSRESTVQMSQADENADAVIDFYNTSQEFSYQDVAGGNIERTTTTKNGAVASDELSGSLAPRAQPPPLKVTA